MRDPECFARCAEKIAFQCFLRREGKRMKHKVDMFGFGAHLFEESLDLVIARHITWKKRRFFSKLADELFQVFFQSLALIIKNQSRAGRGPRPRNRPGNAAFIRHAEDHAGFSCQNLLSHKTPSPYARLVRRKSARAAVYDHRILVSTVTERRYNFTHPQ